MTTETLQSLSQTDQAQFVKVLGGIFEHSPWVAEIAWRHEFLDDNQAFSAAFLEDPATQFQIISAEQARDTIVANLGLGAQLSKSVTVFLDYNGLFSSTMNTHAASAGLRATW